MGPPHAGDVPVAPLARIAMLLRIPTRISVAQLVRRFLLPYTKLKFMRVEEGERK
jgi:hypothetical protein